MVVTILLNNFNNNVNHSFSTTLNDVREKHINLRLKIPPFMSFINVSCFNTIVRNLFLKNKLIQVF